MYFVFGVCVRYFTVRDVYVVWYYQRNDHFVAFLQDNAHSPAAAASPARLTT